MSSAVKGSPPVSEATADATLSQPTEIQGLVDNATDHSLHGWAWNAAQPEERLAVELRLRDEAVARTVAERARSDLAKAGIGDGRHAFELPLKPEWTQRPQELAVVVRTADGTEAALPMRMRRADIDPSGALQRVLEATATAHRQLRKELQSVAARLPTEDPARDKAIFGLVSGQEALAERLEIITIWLTRLDERLAALPLPATSRPRRRDGWQLALALAGAVVLAGAGIGTAVLLLPG
jgi:hypothetical protein